MEFYIILAAIFFPVRPAPLNMEDEMFIAQVKCASEMVGISADNIEAIVSRGAAINTNRFRDKRLIDRRPIELDGGDGVTTKEFYQAKAFVFWNRTLPFAEGRIVGVFWTPTGQPKVFTGKVYPR